jgi:hypothetical protein
MNRKLFFSLLLFPLTGYSAIIPAASPSITDVGNAVNAASNGDTITIPAGSAVWNTTLGPVTKWLSFTGAGIDKTTITVNVSNPGGEAGKAGLLLQGNGYNQLSGITWNGNALTAGPAVTCWSGPAVRIHDCKFIDCLLAVFIAGPLGVIDHNQFINCHVSVRIYGFGNGWPNWAVYYEVPFTSTNYLFIENNAFTMNSSVSHNRGTDHAWMSSGQGSSYVARYNTFTQSSDNMAPCFDWHGDANDGTLGNTSSQVYMNTFNLSGSASIDKFVDARGGQGLVYSNTVNLGAIVLRAELHNRKVRIPNLGSLRLQLADSVTGPWVDVPDNDTNLLGTAYEFAVLNKDHVFVRASGGRGIWVREEWPAGTIVNSNNVSTRVFCSVTNQWQWANKISSASMSTTCDYDTAPAVCAKLDYHDAIFPGNYTQPYPHPLVGSGPTPPANPGTLRIIYSSLGIKESDGSITVNFVREGGFDGPVGCHFSTHDGTALAGVNYTATNGTVSWGDQVSANQTIDVPVINTGMTGNKQFTLTIETPTGGATLVSPTNTTITVIGTGTGAPQTLTWAATNTTTAPIGTGAFVTNIVTKGNGTAGTATVGYFTLNGTATAPGDYVATNGTVTLADGVSSANVLVFAKPPVAFTNRVFYVVLTNANGATLIPPITNAVTILGTPPPNLVLSLASINPNNGVPITNSPADFFGVASSSTPATLTYQVPTNVTLTAPAIALGTNVFKAWLVDGTVADTNRTTTIDLQISHSVTAVYTNVVRPPSTHTVTFASLPLPQVLVANVPADNDGVNGGRTPYTGEFNTGTSIDVTAPLQVGNSTFVKWQLDGTDLTLSQVASLVVNADHTLTAVYNPP